MDMTSIYTTVSWRPQIGDPTFMGWLTVALYFLSALLMWRVLLGCKRQKDYSIAETIIWAGLFVFFLFLTINKQLDLQSLFTDIARVMAKEQGWYGERRALQEQFILILAATAAAAVLALMLLARFAHWTTVFTVMGTVLLLTFIVIRAASFHNFDAFIGDTIYGARWNWVLEIGGILLVMLGATLRLRARQQAKAP